MSVSAETYIVISLMFAVFAAVAAVGTSVVLGAGFERLRAGFEVVKKQTGFFADAIHRLDQKTQRLDEETMRLKSGAYHMDERMVRVEKQVSFMGEAVNSIEQRILQGTPSAQPAAPAPVRMATPGTSFEPKIQNGWIRMPERSEVSQPGLSVAKPSNAPAPLEREEALADVPMAEKEEEANGLTTLLARYLTGEQSGGKGVIYH